MAGGTRTRLRGPFKAEKINFSHGSGGKDMRDLICDVFVDRFACEKLGTLEDQARLALSDFSKLGDRLAFTTDSYVVDPIFFPGGDIGSLAVNGTVNDLAVGGAIPLYLTCSVILEEGFPVSDLRKIVDSMKRAAESAGVEIVTGDTKVVGKNACDKIFINTAGVGVIPAGLNIAATQASPGDVLVVNGYIGDHGAAIVGSRSDLNLQSDIVSDCRALNKLVSAMLESGADIHCLRDATRGGLATVVNEFASMSNVCIRIVEAALPVREGVRGLSEVLGLDPLYLANEGTLAAIVAAQDAERLLQAMRKVPGGQESVVIGEVLEKPEQTVVLKTTFGGERLLDMLVGEQLPRIC